MEPIDDNLSGLQLRWAVAEQVMDFEKHDKHIGLFYLPPHGQLDACPPYEYDIAACRQVDARIKDMQLTTVYAQRLIELVEQHREPDLTCAAFRLANASPDLRCRAALYAVRWFRALGDYGDALRDSGNNT